MDQTNFDFQKQPGKARTRFYAPDPKDALVSVITPYYNAGKYFRQTFYSVMNQTFPWFEWIIVNDGSPKAEDVELLHSLAATDPRVTVITQENAGPSQARNTAIAHARTELIVPLDADDLIDPTYLECLYWSLQYNPDAAWSYSNNYGFQEMEYIWNYPFSAETMKTYNFLNYTGMIRKRDISDIGGYLVQKQAFHEDWRFWLDMLSMGKKPVRVGSYLFWYRRLNSGRFSSVDSNKKLTKASDQIIAEAAKTVDVNVRAVEYPLRTSRYPFYTAKYRSWDRKAYNSHRNKRILWIIPWMTMGGSEKFDMDAIAGLKEHGFDSFVLTTTPSENEWRQRFEDYTDEIFSLPDFLDPAHYPEFISYYIQSREIDLVLLTNSYEGYYMAPWIRQHFPDIPIVDYVHMEEWYWRKGGYARTSALIDTITEKTYVCSNATKEAMIGHFGRAEESLETVYIGVDEAQFDRTQVPAGQLYEQLGIPTNRPIVLFVGRLHPQKRPFLMLEAAKRVSAEIPDVAFVVLGDGPQAAPLKRAVKAAGLKNTVYFLGQQVDVRPCYRDAKLTLICSLKEGLSLTAYESCAMGVPVVSADVGGQKELISEDVGVLIPCLQSEAEDLDNRDFSAEEAAAYANAIVKLLSEQQRWEQMSRNCREKIRKGFTSDRMIRYFRQAFEKLTSDETLKQHRRSLSQALQLCDPLAAELYAGQVMLQSAENAANQPAGPKSIFAKAVQIFQDEGLKSFVLRTARWGKRRICRILGIQKG